MMTPRKIRLVRTRLGLTIRVASARVGVSPMTWYRWESGKSTPHPTFRLTLVEMGVEAGVPCSGGWKKRRKAASANRCNS